MPEHRIPKRIFYGELAEGARLRGSQKKRYKDTLKIALRDCNIDTDSWETVALDGPTWRCAVTKGAAYLRSTASREPGVNVKLPTTALPILHQKIQGSSWADKSSENPPTQRQG